MTFHLKMTDFTKEANHELYDENLTCVSYLPNALHARGADWPNVDLAPPVLTRAKMAKARFRSIRTCRP